METPAGAKEYALKVASKEKVRLPCIQKLKIKENSGTTQEIGLIGPEGQISYAEFKNGVDLNDRVEFPEEKKCLELYHYKNVTEESKVMLREFRGLIFSIQDPKEDNTERVYNYYFALRTKGEDIKNGVSIVARSFFYTPEYIGPENHNKFKKNFSADMEFLRAYDCTVIRLYHFNGKWQMSTHRKIDANTSKWCGPESFKHIFQDCLVATLQDHNENRETAYEYLLSVLDPKRCYVFLAIGHPHNRYVCKPNICSLYYSATFDGMNLIKNDTLHIQLKYPERLHFENFEEMSKFVETSDPKDVQGVVALCGDIHYKFTSTGYARMADLRGNQPSLRFRYLELRQDKPDEKQGKGLFEFAEKLKEFIQLYPEGTNHYQDVENGLVALSKILHKLYVERYINKKEIRLMNEEHHILYYVFNRYLSDRSMKVYPKQIMDQIDRTDPIPLNQPLKRVLRLTKALETANKIENPEEREKEIKKIMEEEYYPKLFSQYHLYFNFMSLI